MGPMVMSSEHIGNSVLYSSVTIKGYKYHVGDFAYFDPDSFTFNVRHRRKSKHEHCDIKLVFFVLLCNTHFLVWRFFAIISYSAVN